MREIKFRAWDGCEMIFMDMKRDGIYICGTHKELMQYTGLQDSKGVDIYEGDIVTGIANRKYVLRFITDGWCLDAGVTPRLHDYIHDCGNILEVIGNIYEHKHLLEDKP